MYRDMRDRLFLCSLFCIFSKIVIFPLTYRLLSLFSDSTKEEMAENIVSHSDLETQNILLNHVVLPRVLPQEKSRFFHEQALIIQFVETVEAVSEWLPEKTVEMMDRLKRVTREHTRTVISEIINELEPGDSFSMFVRRQNSTIMFYIPKTADNSTEEPQNIIVATFMGTLHPKEIFKHESDMEVSPFFVRQLRLLL